MRGVRIPEIKRARTLRRDATSAERKLWVGLRNRALGGHKFVRQEPIGPYYADFACREARLVIEIDGATHSTQDELAYDKRRENFLRAEGYRIIRFTNADVYEQADCVFDAILAALSESGTLASIGVGAHPTGPSPYLSPFRCAYGERSGQRSRSVRRDARRP